MPTHGRVVEIKLPEAELLADLYEVRFDLQAAERLGLKAIDIAEVAPVRDMLVEEAVVTAAVMRYVRCFVQGLRLRLTVADLSGLDANLIEQHDYFLSLRDRFIAHPVNAFEQTYVTVTASEKDGELLPITAVNAGQHRLMLSDSTAYSLVPLVRAVLAIVQKRIVHEQEKLLALLQALPLETIHAGDLHKHAGMGHHLVNKPRRRNKKKR